MPNRASRILTIVRKQLLTTNMMRITLGGEALRDFPEGQESAYMKLSFVSKSGKPCVRSYSIRAYDPQALTLTIDFVVHGDNGPASAWAIQSKVGEQIVTNGPGPVKLVSQAADWFLIAGDMTALPAIGVNLETLPQDAQGYAVIEVISADDRQLIEAPSGVQVLWVTNPHPDTPNTILADVVKALDWLEGRPNIWLASEFDTMRNLRRYFKTERGVDRADMYASSYWKMGETDEGHKAAKKRDAEAD
ncbi:NADPH-dependent ferric siderophore reductase [Candidatus Endobugula sertula]|uniref:NADPH-dependent ferric siderophore reductase n=1 Tax=Candidatus Endobugula sertula TaxID=62101 RepID=A0A1D2QLW0_9GAMM|nr:NADPH-dependent ferric siderophore reductase [Candidatus Endobugula sertula]